MGSEDPKVPRREQHTQQDPKMDEKRSKEGSFLVAHTGPKARTPRNSRRKNHKENNTPRKDQKARRQEQHRKESENSAPIFNKGENSHLSRNTKQSATNQNSSCTRTEKDICLDSTRSRT